MRIIDRRANRGVTMEWHTRRSRSVDLKTAPSPKCEMVRRTPHSHQTKHGIKKRDMLRQPRNARTMMLVEQLV
jgi:hypothetical protein